MRQRLGLATAMLGDPPVLVLDEPSNGLDPEGIVWLRGLLRHLAGQGRTVLVSSHVLSEVQQMVDDVVIINRGSLIQQAPLADLVRRGVRLVSPHAERLAPALAQAGLEVTVEPDGRTLHVYGGPAEQVGHLAFEAGCELHALTEAAEGLEQQFLSLTGARTEGAPA
jgi:ABC-2 type transport system ATP-binding protein